VSRHFDDLDAVLEFDALDDFGELIFALQSSPRFRSGIDHWPRCGRPDCEKLFLTDSWAWARHETELKRFLSATKPFSR
jgi:hypothetical protein